MRRIFDFAKLCSRICTQKGENVFITSGTLGSRSGAQGGAVCILTLGFAAASPVS